MAEHSKCGFPIFGLPKKKHKYQCPSENLRVPCPVWETADDLHPRLRPLGNGPAAVQTTNCGTRERPREGNLARYGNQVDIRCLNDNVCRGLQKRTHLKPGAKAVGLHAGAPLGLFPITPFSSLAGVTLYSIIIQTASETGKDRQVFQNGAVRKLGLWSLWMSQQLRVMKGRLQSSTMPMIQNIA